MTKTDIGIYRGLKEKFDPEVHVGFFITTDTGELLLGDQSLGQTISGWEINDGVLILKLNTGRDIRVTFPEATETVKGLLSAADKAQLNALQANLNSKVDKVTGKSLLADSEIEKLAGLPNSTELTNSIATAKAAGDNAQSDLNAHKQNTSNPHEVTKAQIGLGNVTNDAQVKRSEMGVASGVATLDATGKIPISQIPSDFDDVIDVYATYTKSDTGSLSNITLYLDAAKTQLVTGEAGKLYQNVEQGQPSYQFKWAGTEFVQSGASSLIIGEVASTAYDGAKGKANADNIAKIKGTSLSHIKDAAPVTTAADKISINYECYEGDQYGAAGTDHTADIPAATTSKAGVMSAADKTKLENLNSKLVVADEEDVTAVEGKIKLKDRDTTNGMGYKILRLPENGILTQDMINEANTIYEIRYDFDLNSTTIAIPENCTLKFEGGKLSNGSIKLSLTFIQGNEGFFSNILLSGKSKNEVVKSSWFDGTQVEKDITSISLIASNKDSVKIELSGEINTSKGLEIYNTKSVEIFGGTINKVSQTYAEDNLAIYIVDSEIVNIHDVKCSLSVLDKSYVEDSEGGNRFYCIWTRFDNVTAKKVSILNCIFEDKVGIPNKSVKPYNGTIWIGTYANVSKNIDITNNRFINSCGRVAYITNCENVTVLNNFFVNSGHSEISSNGYNIELLCVRLIGCYNNIVTNNVFTLSSGSTSLNKVINITNNDNTEHNISDHSIISDNIIDMTNIGDSSYTAFYLNHSLNMMIFNNEIKLPSGRDDVYVLWYNGESDDTNFIRNIVFRNNTIRNSHKAIFRLYGVAEEGNNKSISDSYIITSNMFYSNTLIEHMTPLLGDKKMSLFYCGNNNIIRDGKLDSYYHGCNYYERGLAELRPKNPIDRTTFFNSTTRNIEIYSETDHTWVDLIKFYTWKIIR